MITHIQINLIGDKRGTFKVMVLDDDKHADEFFVIHAAKSAAGGLLIQTLIKLVEKHMERGY